MFTMLTFSTTTSKLSQKKTIYAVETSVVNVRNSQETKCQTKKFSVKFKKKSLFGSKDSKEYFKLKKKTQLQRH